MIKIMIVDDMPIFREYLRSAINWESYGFQVCCEATNGQEALELAKINEPDIVLSDINMPYLDGLQLTDALKTCCPETSVVLITGHSEFEYARRAIKLGAADFIVKPFEKEELIVTLLSLQDNIQRSMEYAVAHKDQLYTKREHYLRHFIYDKAISPADVQSFTTQISLSSQAFFRVIAMDIDTRKDALEDFELAMSWKRSVSTMMENLMDEGEKRYSFTDYEGRMIVLIQYDRSPIETMTTDDFNPLIDLMKERLNLQVTLGIGTFQSGFSGIRRSYQEAITAINHRHHSPTSPSVIPYNLISKEEKAMGFYSSEVNEALIITLSQGLLDETLRLIQSTFDKSEKEHYSPDLKHMMYMGLSSLLLSYLVKIGQNLEDVFPFGFEGSKELQLSVPDHNQQAFILSAYEKVLLYLSQKRESRASKVAAHAKAYIDQHYREQDFNMNHLTHALLVNQTYLRSMFKSEMGMTISDYVTKCKMDAAKALLIKGEHRLAHIAEYLGYSDSSYFSKCFKRYFGISPSDYRE